jgi:hypothetical protein
MKCPHCRVEIHEIREIILIGSDIDGGWGLIRTDCPSCQRMILRLVNGPPMYNQFKQLVRIREESKIFLFIPRVVQDHLVRPKLLRNLRRIILKPVSLFLIAQKPLPL